MIDRPALLDCLLEQVFDGVTHFHEWNCSAVVYGPARAVPPRIVQTDKE